MPLLTSSANLNVSSFACSGFDARILRAGNNDTLSVLENSFTTWGLDVCLFDMMCPLGLSLGWTMLIFDGLKRGFQSLL